MLDRVDVVRVDFKVGGYDEHPSVRGWDSSIVVTAGATPGPEIEGGEYREAKYIRTSSVVRLGLNKGEPIEPELVLGDEDSSNPPGVLVGAGHRAIRRASVSPDWLANDFKWASREDTSSSRERSIAFVSNGDVILRRMARVASYCNGISEDRFRLVKVALIDDVADMIHRAVVVSRDPSEFPSALGYYAGKLPEMA